MLLQAYYYLSSKVAENGRPHACFARPATIRRHARRINYLHRRPISASAVQPGLRHARQRFACKIDGPDDRERGRRERVRTLTSLSVADCSVIVYKLPLNEAPFSRKRLNSFICIHTRLYAFVCVCVCVCV